MRNVDKIRTLENQNELLKKQIDELRAYQSKYDNLQKVYNALNLSNMAIMIAVALQFGDQAEDGYKLVMPKVEVEALLKEYNISAVRGEDNRLIITVKKEEQHDEADIQGSEEAAGGGSEKAEADKVQEPGM